MVDDVILCDSLPRNQGCGNETRGSRHNSCSVGLVKGLC